LGQHAAYLDILQALKDNTSLTSLNLTGNQITLHQLTRIVESLPQNLKELDINWTPTDKLLEILEPPGASCALDSFWPCLPFVRHFFTTGNICAFCVLQIKSAQFARTFAPKSKRFLEYPLLNVRMQRVST
jgi:hypothetical protein